RAPHRAGRHAQRRSPGRLEPRVDVAAGMRARTRRLSIASIAIALAVAIGVPPLLEAPARAASSCRVADLDRAAGLAAGSGFARAKCASGWALAAGSRTVRGGAALFR